MRNRLWLTFLASTAIAASTMSPANAQSLGPITLNFATPQSIDPTLVIFTSPGTKTVAGTDLISNSPVPFAPGVEVHSRITGPHGGILDINSLEIQFDYAGQISINPPPGPPTPGFVNWTVQSLSVVNNHYDIVFINPFPPFSAPINDNFDPGPNYPSHQSSAGIGVTGNQTALADFIRENPANNVKITAGSIGIERGGVVPEPGAFAMFGGMGLTLGGWMLRRRLRTGRRKSA